MTDIYTKAKRSEIMARIKGCNTSPEHTVERLLRKLKIKYRRNVKSVIGQPDFVVNSLKTVIFVHGCFWHNHERCKRAKLPKTNKNFWKRKIEGNKKRDLRIERALRKQGWQVLTIWQCRLRQPKRVLRRLEKSLLNH